ncbi:hypothetical protein I79_005069 [Cricetulus griseus]|uniref:Secreted protein n=1 Tax=Cricetulus griseus TaxID=10029 RepID=G3H469_CRIGR|nr:hypothetical protein I79_005069 [Cricetulus griseus]
MPLCCFNTGFLGTALTVLALLDQAGLILRSTCLCLPNTGIRGVNHHCLAPIHRIFKFET